MFSVNFICAKEPGKSSPEELSANALICKVLVCWLTPGSIANTFPLKVLAYAPVVNEISEFNLI